MAQPQMIQVKLSRFDAQPWGFRLQGGVDFAAPLLVQKVNAGSLAEKAGLLPGDSVIKINDVDVYNLRHKEAQDVVVRSGNNFVITVQRGGSTWRPQVTPTGQLPQPNQHSSYLQTVTKTSLAHKQQDVNHIGCGYNNAARPFANGADGSIKSIVNKQYNTPVGIYSDESIAETLSAQAEVLAGGVLGVNFKKNEKEYQAEKSEVLKFLREEETGESTPALKNHQHYHQEPQQQQQYQPSPQQQYQSATRHVSAPVNNPKPSTGGLPTGQNICTECDRLITGVFVRIKDKNLHVECFKCATCGTSLKNQGYYNFNNKLYCDIHAKLAALQSPPSGTEGYVPVPIKPNTKLSANTISSALNAYGYSNGVANGGSAHATSEEIIDLPLPPPPSPTQLQQFQYDNQPYYNNNNSTNQQEPNHTRTHSSLSTQSNSSSTCSSMSPISPQTIANNSSNIGTDVAEIVFSHPNNNNNNLNDNNNLVKTASPSHSRKTSSSFLPSLSAPVGNLSTLVPTPPPPPPLLPTAAETTFPFTTNNSSRHQNSTKMMQQHVASIAARLQHKQQQQNENDMNIQNKNAVIMEAGTGLLAAATAATTTTTTNNLYNKFLKEYSNKFGTPQTNTISYTNNNTNNIKINNSNNNNNNTLTSPTLDSTCNNKTSHINRKIANGTAKPFSSWQTPPASNVAAASATLANQLKFNPCQVVNPAATIDTAAKPATAAPPTAEGVAATLNALVDTQVDSKTISSNHKSNKMLADQQSSSSAANAAQSPGDQPFEYVTLTGNVIRSVVPPGKGVSTNYKVNQGYARPFGSPVAPSKSPVAYPPQQQQPKTAVNPYATLPRSNVAGQQELCLNTNTTATLPRKPFSGPLNANNMSADQKNHSSIGVFQKPQRQPLDTHCINQENATALLADSIGKIDMGDNTNNFMTEAGKIISNMLEARLANNSNGSALSKSGSSLSLRSNSSSNVSKSPMVMRKRFELDDFKDFDPTESESFKPVVALPQSISNPPHGLKPSSTGIKDLNHPMGKVLQLCDNRPQAVAPKSSGCMRQALTSPQQLKTPITPSSVMPTKAPHDGALETITPLETVVFRNDGSNNRRAGRGGELSTHAIDRRSYIELAQAPSQADDAPKTEGEVFSIAVKPLGRGCGENTPMSLENEEVFTQLLKGGKRPICCQCQAEITKGPFITALGRIWCPDHFICVNGNCRRPLQDIGFVEEKGDLYCEYCFEKYLAPTCSNCAAKIKGDCLNAIGKHFHPECFTCAHCGKLFGNTPFFLEEGKAYCEADWNELFTTKCFACGFPVEAGDRWVEALNNNYHSQCFNCTFCKQNLEGQSFYNKGGRPFCKNHAR